MDRVEQFTVAITREGTAPVVRLSGELDLTSAPELDESLDQIRTERPDRLTFDLAAVSFMDSSGLSALIRAANHAEVTIVRSPSDAVRIVLEATGLDELFVVEP